MRYIYSIKFGMFEVRENEIALRKLSAGTAHLRVNAGFEERETCLDLLSIDSNYQAHNQGVAQPPLENFLPHWNIVLDIIPTIGHSSKNLVLSQKTLRPSWHHKLVTGLITSTWLLWSFVLTRCILNLRYENSDAGHLKCSRGPQVARPWFTLAATNWPSFLKNSPGMFRDWHDRWEIESCAGNTALAYVTNSVACVDRVRRATHVITCCLTAEQLLRQLQAVHQITCICCTGSFFFAWKAFFFCKFKVTTDDCSKITLLMCMCCKASKTRRFAKKTYYYCTE